MDKSKLRFAIQWHVSITFNLIIKLVANEEVPLRLNNQETCDATPFKNTVLYLKPGL